MPTHNALPPASPSGDAGALPFPDAHGRSAAAATPLFIGLMSGTSTDGVDGVLARFAEGSAPQVLSSAFVPMPAALRQSFLALNQPGDDELRRAAMAGNALAALYAQTVRQLLDEAGLDRQHIDAIGAHGQTVRHDPEAGYSLQINAPAVLAERTGIDVIADFRSRDIAAGGQGAPLVPAFHDALFGGDQPRAILNLGGIANLTILRPGQAPQGFDTGPANMLLDAWIHERRGQPYDDNGNWADSGSVNQALLRHLLQSEPWFDSPPPKSTGRDRFNLPWLWQRLQSFPGRLPDADIQATLQRLTADSIAMALLRWGNDVREVIVCGGGARNGNLMSDLSARLHAPVLPSSHYGVPEQQVEALAFAWLARAFRLRQPAGLPSVTGARHARVLGCCYPA